MGAWLVAFCRFFSRLSNQLLLRVLKKYRMVNWQPSHLGQHAQFRDAAASLHSLPLRPDC
jgi:hypothetical protein